LQYRNVRVGYQADRAECRPLANFVFSVEVTFCFFDFESTCGCVALSATHPLSTVYYGDDDCGDGDGDGIVLECEPYMTKMIYLYKETLENSSKTVDRVIREGNKKYSVGRRLLCSMLLFSISISISISLSLIVYNMSPLWYWDSLKD